MLEDLADDCKDALRTIYSDGGQGGILWVKTRVTLGENRWGTYGRLLTDASGYPEGLSVNQPIVGAEKAKRLQSDCASA